VRIAPNRPAIKTAKGLFKHFMKLSSRTILHPLSTLFERRKIRSLELFISFNPDFGGVFDGDT